MTSGASRPLRAKRSRSSKAKGGTPAASAPQQRSSAYRGVTRDAAAAAYHEDARVMARMGFVPESEAWSTQLEQVLVVGYVHAPDRASAVLEAIAKAEIEPFAELLPTRPARRSPRELALALPLEARLALGGVGGAVAGVAGCLALAVIAGDRADPLIIAAFAFLGLFLGLIGAFPRH